MKKNIILSIVLMVLLSSVVNAQATIKEIKERGTLRVGTSGKQLPYTFKEEDGTYVGLDVELGKRLAKDIEVDVVFVQIEIPSLIDSLNAGAIDVIMSGFSITNERNMQVLFTEPYFETGKAILSTNSKLLSGKIKNINKTLVKILVLKNSSSAEMVKTHYPNAKIIEANNAKEAREILLTDKADAYIGDIEICEYYAYDPEFGKYKYTVLKQDDSADHEFIAVAIASDDMLFYNFVNNFIKKQIDRNGEGWILNTWNKYYDYL